MLTLKSGLLFKAISTNINIQLYIDLKPLENITKSNILLNN